MALPPSDRVDRCGAGLSKARRPWAYRFVVHEVSTKIGRHCWRNHPDTLEADAWERIPDSLAASPQLASEQREPLGVLPAAIDNDLTDLQRRVFVAIALNDVPMDAFARELGSNRNAIYTLFDARRSCAGASPLPATRAPNPTSRRSPGRRGSAAPEVAR